MSKTADEMFEELEGVEPEVGERMLDELTEIGMVVKTIDMEDVVRYQAKEGVMWDAVAHFDCPIKKQIMLRLINNPRTFFVLYNTQKGKSIIVASEIKQWATADKKVVAFLVVDNDKSLAEQTREGLFDEISSVAHVFLLSSNSKETTVEGIRTYTDAYAADRDGEYKMPVVVALNNADQVKKVLKLMDHINTKVEVRGSALRYGVVFDEADKVYPKMRTREFAMDGGVTTSFKKLLVDNVIAVHRLGFVTATDGDLLEDEEYEECANAYMYPVPAGDENYRAIHHEEDAVVKHVQHRKVLGNDVYAEKVLEDNKEYFAGRVTLKDGSKVPRKVIVNGGAKTTSMAGFAYRRTAEGAYAITLNMFGVTVYRPGKTPERRSSKGVRLNRLLFDLYKELGLHDKMLFIIGRRKVDRGLGFHYAPRDGSEGLVWTDMILGRIDDKNTAVQKAGRLAGVVAHCPQYPGKLTWWTDERTSAMILRHNAIVDVANTKRGHTALQAVKRAEDGIPKVVHEAHHESVSHMEPFESMEALRARWAEILLAAGCPAENARTPTRRNGKYICSIGGESDVQTVRDITAKFPNGGSTANWGSGLTTAPVGKYIHRAYAGYEADDRVVFFLRWTRKV